MSRNLFQMVGLFALFPGFAVPAESCTYFFAIYSGQYMSWTAEKDTGKD
jgi:hypothetical protein